MAKLLPLLPLGGLLLAGCSLFGPEPQPAAPPPPDYGVSPRPEAYSKGVSAPAVYKIAPRAPRSMGYPGFEVAEAPIPSPAPKLPPVDAVFPGNAITLREPVLSGMNPDLVAKRPFPVEGLDPQHPMPVEQEVYGGPYPEKEADQPYVYHEGDKVNINIKNQPEFNGVATIEIDGKLRIPGTEDYVPAAGQNAHMIGVSIARAIRPYVKEQPAVRITTELAQGGYYYIFGGVKNQGRFPIGGKALRLSEAVFRADASLYEKAKTLGAMGNEKGRDGFEPKKGGWLGEVILVTPHHNYPEVNTYNVAQTLYGGKKADDPLVRPDQIVIVRDANNPELEEYLRQIMAGKYPGQKTIRPVPLSKPMPLVTTVTAPVILSTPTANAAPAVSVNTQGGETVVDTTPESGRGLTDSLMQMIKRN